MLLPTSTSTRNDLIQAIALLTGHNKTTISDIDSTLYPTFNKVEYLKNETWKRVLKCADLVRRIGVPVSQIQDLIHPPLTVSDDMRFENRTD